MVRLFAILGDEIDALPDHPLDPRAHLSSLHLPCLTRENYTARLWAFKEITPSFYTNYARHTRG